MVVKLVEDTGYAEALALIGFRIISLLALAILIFLSCKKQEVAAYDPRGAQATGLGYATSNAAPAIAGQTSNKIVGCGRLIRIYRSKPNW